MEKPQIKHLIYGFLDPSSAKLFYIGRSSSGLKGRPRAKHNPFCERKWNSLKRKGIHPEIISLLEFEVCEDIDLILNREETDLVKLFRLLGHPLTNLTDGGEGTSGYPSVWKGKKLSEKHKKNVSRAKSGKSLSAEHRLRLSQAMRGKNKGRKLSDTQRQKISKQTNEQWVRRRNGDKDAIGRKSTDG
jgi:hypothetical protein